MKKKTKKKVSKKVNMVKQLERQIEELWAYNRQLWRLIEGYEAPMDKVRKFQLVDTTQPHNCDGHYCDGGTGCTHAGYLKITC